MQFLIMPFLLFKWYNLISIVYKSLMKSLWDFTIFLIVSGFTMLNTPVPIRSLKLSNIGPGYYLDGRPLQGISGSAGTSPHPLQIEYSLFRLSLSQSSDWDLYQQKKIFLILNSIKWYFNDTKLHKMSQNSIKQYIKWY